MSQILASQTRMLRQKGNMEDISDDAMAKKFDEHLKKIQSGIERHRNIECLYVNYEDVIKNPSENAYYVAKFLGKDLYVGAMVRSVNKTLRRDRDV